VFNGSTNYGAAYAQTSFTIGKAIPTIAISDAGGSYNGNPYAATATLTGASGSPTSNLDGVSLTVTYYQNGQALAAPPTLPGSYYAVAVFNGSANYGAAYAYTIFTIAKAIPTVAISDAGGTYNGNPYAATATLAGASGLLTSSLDGVQLTVTYYQNGQALATAPTLPGTYSAVAIFNGSANYGASYAVTTFTIAKAAPTIVITAPSGVHNGHPFIATALIAGINGQQATTLEGVGLTITYYQNGQALASAPSLPGRYIAVALFNGSADYSGESVRTTFTIS
jgi:hypothetical protein